MITVDNPSSKIFARWGAVMAEEVGAGHYSMDASLTEVKTPYARLLLMGMPFTNGDLEGNEASVDLSVQVDCFASGNKSLSKVYEIDAASHQALRDMGFRRTYGPELMLNADESIKRTVSRYTMIYTGYLLNDSDNN